MKLRDKILYMSFGAGLVVLGMVLNSLVSSDAEAQGGVKDATFRTITCQNVAIVDGNGKWRGAFGVAGSDAVLKIYGDDGKTEVVFLGGNILDPNNEMMFRLRSKSKTDKREASMMIDGNGGRFDGHNKMGEAVVRIGVGNDGGGGVKTKDKYGYTR